MSDEYTPTDQEIARQEIAEAREAYWIDQMRRALDEGEAQGGAKRLCQEIDIEQKARGFKPTRDSKRIEAIMQSCPF